jgi:hypothetical protein
MTYSKKVRQTELRNQNSYADSNHKVMKTPTKHFPLLALAAAATLIAPTSTVADVTLGVDPGQTWIGYMNVFNLPSDGGAYQFGSSWGTADLTAVFAGGTLTLGPNTIGDPDPYWYIGGGGPGAAGNKIMDANMYVETTDLLNGQMVTFSGTVLANTLVSPFTSVAFIKDFAPDYSSFTTTTVPLSAGAFSVSLNTDAGAGRHVQYGFETIGPDVWITDVAPYGSVVIEAVPEPSTLALAGLATLGIATLRRRRS